MDIAPTYPIEITRVVSHLRFVGWAAKYEIIIQPMIWWFGRVYARWDGTLSESFWVSTWPAMAMSFSSTKAIQSSPGLEGSTPMWPQWWWNWGGFLNYGYPQLVGLWGTNPHKSGWWLGGTPMTHMAKAFRFLEGDDLGWWEQMVTGWGRDSWKDRKIDRWTDR